MIFNVVLFSNLDLQDLEAPNDSKDSQSSSDMSRNLMEEIFGTGLPSEQEELQDKGASTSEVELQERDLDRAGEQNTAHGQDGTLDLDTAHEQDRTHDLDTAPDLNRSRDFGRSKVNQKVGRPIEDLKRRQDLGGNIEREEEEEPMGILDNVTTANDTDPAAESHSLTPSSVGNGYTSAAETTAGGSKAAAVVRPSSPAEGTPAGVSTAAAVGAILPAVDAASPGNQDSDLPPELGHDGVGGEEEESDKEGGEGAGEQEESETERLPGLLTTPGADVIVEEEEVDRVETSDHKELSRDDIGNYRWVKREWYLPVLRIRIRLDP